MQIKRKLWEIFIHSFIHSFICLFIHSCCTTDTRVPTLSISKETRSTLDRKLKEMSISVQSDQCLCCSLFLDSNTCSCYIQDFKTLASFCNWTAQFESCRKPQKTGFLISWLKSYTSMKVLMDGWLGFTSFWTVFQSHQDNGRLNMKGSVQWSAVQVRKQFRIQRDLNPRPSDQKSTALTTQPRRHLSPVWSESSLSAWRKLGSLATHWAHSEDSDQTGRMPRRIWVFAGRTLILLVLSCRGSLLWQLGCWHYVIWHCGRNGSTWSKTLTLKGQLVTRWHQNWTPAQNINTIRGQSGQRALHLTFEPHHAKMSLRRFGPGKSPTSLLSYRN